MINVFSDLIANSEPDTINTYERDGLIYCVNCDTPRQTVIKHPFEDRDVKVGCLCKCLAEKRDAAEAEHKEQEKRAKIRRARLASFEQSDFVNMTFEADDGKTPELTNKMRNYAKHFQTFKEQGQGLILFGNVGTGKTFYSACIANVLLDEGYSVLMTNFPSLIARMQRNAFKEDTAGLVSEYDLLIVDDLGVERSTEYMQENVYNIIDARYRARKPIIVSTNLSIEEMMQPSEIASKRIYGRLLERCLPVRFEGADRRRSKSKYGDMLELLNS